MKTLQNSSFFSQFLGDAPSWYKVVLLTMLVVNPFLFVADPFLAGWVLVAQFIFTLIMAIKVYPLVSGGLLVLEAMIFGMATPDAAWHHIHHNIPVLLLVLFMVTAINFMRDLLEAVFVKIILAIKNNIVLALLMAFLAAVMSAFLDALTVTAVNLTVFLAFYKIYHRVASGYMASDKHDHKTDDHIKEEFKHELARFKWFLCSLTMHVAVGTMLGGLATLVGEPQNLEIGHMMGWHFVEFYLRMVHISLPVLVAGLMTTIYLESTGHFGYNSSLSPTVRTILRQEFDVEISKDSRAKIIVQAIGAVCLVFALAFHVAEVGIIGLGIMVFVAATTGHTQEHSISHKFLEGAVFSALLAVFFILVAIIDQQHLFSGVIAFCLGLPQEWQELAIFSSCGTLSAISDNVFVASLYMNELKAFFDAGKITQEQFDKLAIAVNAGTNVPSIATPNGQAAFLFILTHEFAALIGLGYFRMLKMAFPYFVVCTIAAILALLFLGWWTSVKYNIVA